MIDFLKNIFNWLKEQGPALAILIYDWKDAEQKKEEQSRKQAELELKLEKNHAEIDEDNAGVSDTDGVGRIAGPRD